MLNKNPKNNPNTSKGTQNLEFGNKSKTWDVICETIFLFILMFNKDFKSALSNLVLIISRFWVGFLKHMNILADVCVCSLALSAEIKSVFLSDFDLVCWEKCQKASSPQHDNARYSSKFVFAGKVSCTDWETRAVIPTLYAASGFFFNVS